MSVAETGTELHRFVQELIGQLVDRPEEVAIVMGQTSGCVTYDVCVAHADVGRLIGRGGRTARAIRTIVQAAAAGKGLRLELNLPYSRAEESEK